LRRRKNLVGNMRDLKLREKVIHDKVDAYRFFFEPYGWFYMFVDEHRGCFSIQSDWGDFAFSWPGQKGNLHKFLFDREDWGYVINKFMYDDNRKKWEIFKEEETIKNLKELIFEFEGEDSENWSDETKEMAEDLEYLQGQWNTAEAFSSALLHSSIAKHCDLYTVMNCIEVGLHPRIKFLRNELLPFIRTEMVKAGLAETHDAEELRP